MAVKADLHIHSTSSDGRMRPGEVVEAVSQLQLSTISLTDHDTIKGIAEAKKAAANYEIAVMNGVEVTTEFEGRESHLLGYAFDITDDGLKQCLEDHKIARVERARFIIDQLKKKGLQLTLDEVRAEAHSSNICRPHIAAVLVGKGFVATHREAFQRYLKDEALEGLNGFYHSLKEVVQVIKQAGGVAVIAHPGRMYSNKEIEIMIAAGIDGIETVHPAHFYDQQKNLEKLARKHNLLMTGGSDYHGRQKKYYRHLGTLGINEQKVQKVALLAQHRKKGR